MLVYRVFPHLPDARPRQPGHPLFVHRPQGRGRWDNPALYAVRYLALDPAAAVAEAFGNLGLRWWTPAMFRFSSAGWSDAGAGCVPARRRHPSS